MKQETIRLLIIEDNQEDRETYARFLNLSKDHHYEISNADTAEEGLEFLKSNEAECILLDYNLPGINGLEFLKELKGFNNISIPVIVLTGQGDESVAVEAMKSGASDYLVKDNLNKDILLRTIHYTIELKKRHSDLAVARKRYREIVEDANDIIFRIDGSGKYTYINPVVKKITGFEQEELVGKNYLDFIVPEHRGKAKALYDDLESKKIKSEAEIKMLHKNGGIIWVSQITQFINEGDNIGIQGIARDITKRKKAEEELKIKDLAIETSANAIVLTDDKGNITYTNNTFHKMWGYKDSAVLIGGSVTVLLVGNEDIDILEQLKDMGTWVGELIAQKADGKRFYVLLTAAKILDEEDVLAGLVFSFSDITMRKNAQESLKEREEDLRERNLTYEKDLKIAHTAQRELLPRSVPDSDFLKIRFRFNPMESVGGDYFSFFPYDENNIGVFIGDISGHGVASALFISLLRSATEKISEMEMFPPGKYITKLNNELMGYMSSYYITGIYGLFQKIDATDRIKFTISNGGHPSPILIRKNSGAEILEKRNMIIGVAKDVEFNDMSTELNPGDRVFLYTDGIPETVNEKKEMIGYDEGILEIFNKAGNAHLDKTLDIILDQVDKFRGKAAVADDCALIGFEIL